MADYQQKIMSMLRRNASYNDATGSAQGSGFLESGSGYIGGCSECGETCMHCGSGYTGGAAKKGNTYLKDFNLRLLNYLKDHQDVSPEDARNAVKLHHYRSNIIGDPNYDDTYKPCGNLEKGRKDYCEWRHQFALDFKRNNRGQGPTREETTAAWKIHNPKFVQKPRKPRKSKAAREAAAYAKALAEITGEGRRRYY
jgi:hypothetical protein